MMREIILTMISVICSLGAYYLGLHIGKNNHYPKNSKTL